jgi:Lon protease-like protein
LIDVIFEIRYPITLKECFAFPLGFGVAMMREKENIDKEEKDQFCVNHI